MFKRSVNGILDANIQITTSIIIKYREKLLDSDWLRPVQLLCNSVQKCVVSCNYINNKKYNVISPQTLLIKINQSRATSQLTVVNLLILRARPH